MRPLAESALETGSEFVVNVLSGQHEGCCHRAMSRFLVSPGDQKPLNLVASVLCHWSLGLPDPQS